MTSVCCLLVQVFRGDGKVLGGPDDLAAGRDGCEQTDVGQVVGLFGEAESRSGSPMAVIFSWPGWPESGDAMDVLCVRAGRLGCGASAPRWIGGGSGWALHAGFAVLCRD